MGATLSFLPLLPAAGMATHKFHQSFRCFRWIVSRTIKSLVLSYFFLRILLYTDFSASLPTAWFGVSAKFAAASLLQVSRIFLAFRASVYCRCQNPSSFNRHQDPHIPFCVAFWASLSTPHGATETSLPQYPAGSLVTASGILGRVDNPLVHRVIRYICQNSFQGACRCSTDE